MGASGREGLTRFDATSLPLELLADWSTRAIAEEAAAKIVDIAVARARLRPAAPIAEH